MYNLYIISSVLLGAATAAFLPYGGVLPYGGGYGGYGAGMGAGYYGRPYYGYSPMMGHGGYYNDLANYAGDGRHYGGLTSNGLLHHSLGSAGAMANGGGHGYMGGQRYADQQQGLGGYHTNAVGGNFNNGAGGFRQGNGFQDAAGRGNIGGFNNEGHNNGHKTTGFHKSYHNVETGRDTKYVDEDHDIGGHNFGQEFGNNFANKFGTGYSGAGGNGQYGSNQHVDHMGQHGLAGGSFNNGNYGAHGGNNYYNGQDMSLSNANLANNMNHFGHGYNGVGNRYGMGGAYMYPW